MKFTFTLEIDIADEDHMATHLSYALECAAIAIKCDGLTHGEALGRTNGGAPEYTGTWNVR